MKAEKEADKLNAQTNKTDKGDDESTVNMNTTLLQSMRTMRTEIMSNDD